MIINKVTFTGADEKTNYNDLLDIQRLYPNVEWGILFSKNGGNRYPNYEKFVGDLNLSAHFCGWYSREVLENQNFDLIRNLPKQFKRVQLNYNFKNSNGWNLFELLSFVNEYKEKDIILQYNKSNKVILDRFLTIEPPSNIHFLYDNSGGRGLKIENIESPITDHYTGYSGGLNPDNIDEVCLLINSQKNDQNVWIDMETGVRTNDDFDILKVKTVLEKISS